MFLDFGRSRRAVQEHGSMVRLVDGGQNYGRVEIFHLGEWGTICDDNWNINNANVVCRMLGYTKASSAFEGGIYAGGGGNIWLDSVDCKGTESSIFKCSKSAWGVHDCDHSEDVSVICELL